MAGLLTLPTLNASAAPINGLAGLHSVTDHGMVTNVDYYWRHRHWHHRRHWHGGWRYW